MGPGPQSLGPAGASDSPGAALGSRGWGGGAVPGPSSAAQTGAGRGAARKRGRGGGPEGGPGRLVTPPCPGLAAPHGGGASRLTPHPLPICRLQALPGSPPLGFQGSRREPALSSPPPAPTRRTERTKPPHFREGAGAGSRNGPLPGGGAFPKGQGQGIPNWGWWKVIKAGVGGCAGYWGQGGISPAQAGLG